MRYELTRVEPLRAANIGALVYGIVMTVFALIFAPFFMLAVAFSPTKENPAEKMAVFGVLCAYPFLGLIMGWISGLVTSAAYNLVIRATGGLVFHADMKDAVTTPPPVEPSGPPNPAD